MSALILCPNPVEKSERLHPKTNISLSGLSLPVWSQKSLSWWEFVRILKFKCRFDSPRGYIIKRKSWIRPIFSLKISLSIWNKWIVQNFPDNEKSPVTLDFSACLSILSILRFGNGRGGRNRTLAKGFGDLCHTIWPHPCVVVHTTTT